MSANHQKIFKKLVSPMPWSVPAESGAWSCTGGRLSSCWLPLRAQVQTLGMEGLGFVSCLLPFD